MDGLKNQGAKKLKRGTRKKEERKGVKENGKILVTSYSSLRHAHCSHNC